MEIRRTLYRDEEKGNRIFTILDEIKQGKKSHEIAAHQTPRQARYYGKRDNSGEIGFATEQRVFSLLLTHPLVDSLEIEDKKQRGIEGFIRLTQQYSQRCVPLQVKSSETGVDKFMSQDYDWVVSRYGEPVILNGGPEIIDNNQILDSFELQLKSMGILPPEYSRSA